MMKIVAVFLLVCSLVPEMTLKSVFVLGDSISMHYGSFLEETLKGTFLYDRKRDDGGVSDLGVPAGPNGGDSRMVLEYLKAKQKDPSFRPDILLVNCGLHDIKRDLKDDKALQIAPEQYRKNLKELYSITCEIGAKLIWIRTTPVVDAIHNNNNRQFLRFEEDLAKYNRIADSVFEELEVPILDLHQFTKSMGERSFIDHVHYDQRTRALQAAFIAGFLQRFR
jgi:hypothetical protein